MEEKITNETLIQDGWINEGISYSRDWAGSKYRLFLSHNYGEMVIIL